MDVSCALAVRRGNPGPSSICPNAGAKKNAPVAQQQMHIAEKLVNALLIKHMQHCSSPNVVYRGAHVIQRCICSRQQQPIVPTNFHMSSVSRPCASMNYWTDSNIFHASAPFRRRRCHWLRQASYNLPEHSSRTLISFYKHWHVNVAVVITMYLI